MKHIIAEMDSLGPDHPVGSSSFRAYILAPIQLPVRFVGNTLEIDEQDSERLKDMYARTNYGGNKWTWDNFLHDLFGRSAVSLISETGGYEKLSSLTEKTLYAFLGLTFPIWIGSYGTARALKEMGFDVFDDIIDHDYQWHDTMIERCYWAFELNKKILCDIDHARHLRSKELDRLMANRRFLLDDGLGSYCQQKIEQCPARYRDAIMNIKKKFDFYNHEITVDRSGSSK